MSRVWTGCNEERKTIEPMTTFSTEIKKRSESSESQERKTLAMLCNLLTGTIGFLSEFAKTFRNKTRNPSSLKV